MFLNLLLLSFVIIALSMLGLGLNILIKKKGKFPSYQVGHNKDMHNLGISCVKHDERKDHRKRRINNGEDCSACQQLSC